MSARPRFVVPTVILGSGLLVLAAAIFNEWSLRALVPSVQLSSASKRLVVIGLDVAMVLFALSSLAYLFRNGKRQVLLAAIHVAIAVAIPVTAWAGYSYFRSRMVSEVLPFSPLNSEQPSLPTVARSDWPWWRGPTLDGKASPQTPPLRWSETENVVWRTEVLGRGHASPIIWGEKIFVASADEQSQSQYLLGFDRRNGEPLWQSLIHQGGFVENHEKNSYASSTPACDGNRIYAAFLVAQQGQEGVWVTATNLEGELLWQKLAGPFASLWGYGASPVLYKSLVIVAGDNMKSGFLAALDRATGDVYWRVRREALASFATPVVARIADREQLLVHGANWVISYNPNSGTELWRCRAPSEAAANTMSFDKERVYATFGSPKRILMAIRADGSGDVTETHVAWQTRKAVSYVPSMLVHGEHLFSFSDRGIATCYEAANGNVLWTKRLGGDFSSSPVLVGERIYISDEDGKMHILRAAQEYESLATVHLEDGGFASPVIVDNQIYLRTNRFLYCIGGRSAVNTVSIIPDARHRTGLADRVAKP